MPLCTRVLSERRKYDIVVVFSDGQEPMKLSPLSKRSPPMHISAGGVPPKVTASVSGVAACPPEMIVSVWQLLPEYNCAVIPAYAHGGP